MEVIRVSLVFLDQTSYAGVCRLETMNSDIIGRFNITFQAVFTEDTFSLTLTRNIGLGTWLAFPTTGSFPNSVLICIISWKLYGKDYGDGQSKESHPLCLRNR
uniref:Uncharacterized protein n=1 Tax=Rhodnius prolixus TaxID=13249 RepID=T1HIU3_RHOPR